MIAGVREVRVEEIDKIAARSAGTGGLRHLRRSDPRNVYLGDCADGAASSGLVVCVEPFDSEILELQIGRLSLIASTAENAGALVRCGIAAARERGYGQLVAVVPADAWEAIWALAGNGFRLVDVGVTLLHDLKEIPVACPDAVFETRLATAADRSWVVARCGRIFRRSRYYVDPSYPERAVERLHERWIANCFEGRADAILLSLRDGEPAGFVTCAVDQETRAGRIELIGMAEESRAKGGGRQMMGSALRWFREHAERVYLKTQATNYASVGLCTGSGFRLCSTDLTLSLDLRESP